MLKESTACCRRYGGGGRGRRGRFFCGGCRFWRRFGRSPWLLCFLGLQHCDQAVGAACGGGSWFAASGRTTRGMRSLHTLRTVCSDGCGLLGVVLRSAWTGRAFIAAAAVTGGRRLGRARFGFLCRIVLIFCHTITIGAKCPMRLLLFLFLTFRIHTSVVQTVLHTKKHAKVSDCS